MAHRRPAAAVGGVRLVDDHRFAGPRGRLDQPATVGDALQVQADHPGGRVRAQVVEEIDLVQIEPVADAGEPGQAELFTFQEVPEEQPEAAALRDERKGTRPHRQGGHERQAEAACGVGQGEPVGADEANGVAPGRRAHLLGEAPAGLTRLVEAAGLDGQPADTGAAAVLHRGGHVAGRDEQHRQVGREGQVGGARIDVEIIPSVVRGLRVDADDRPAEAPAAAVVEDDAGGVARPAGQAVDGQRAGSEEAVHDGSGKSSGTGGVFRAKKARRPYSSGK